MITSWIERSQMDKDKFTKELHTSIYHILKPKLKNYRSETVKCQQKFHLVLTPYI